MMRPAGSINASANDMAAYLQFYLNRGAGEGKQMSPPPTSIVWRFLTAPGPPKTV